MLPLISKLNFSESKSCTQKDQRADDKESLMGFFDKQYLEAATQTTSQNENDPTSISWESAS